MGDCTKFVIKGYVQQVEATDSNSTAVSLSIPSGSVQDCAGQAFPGASLRASISNRCAPNDYLSRMRCACMLAVCGTL